MKAKLLTISILTVIGLLLLSGCAAENTGAPATQPAVKPPPVKPPVVEYPDIDRESKIPASQAKITPETDIYPPVLHSDEYEQPVPMPYPINSAGAEDSGFMMPDGNTFYVWFTPDPQIPPQKQVIDSVTGIYMSKKVNGQWQKPERVWLQDPDKLSLDGCEFVQNNKIWRDKIGRAHV